MRQVGGLWGDCKAVGAGRFGRYGRSRTTFSG